MDTYTATATLVQETTLNVIEIEDNLHVFELETTQKRTHKEGRLALPRSPKIANRVEGFVDSQNLEKLRAGKAYKTRSELSILLEDGRTVLREAGFVVYNDPPLLKRVTEASLKNVFEAFKDGLAGKDDLVIVRNDCHMLFDRNNAPLPVAIPFDYISHGRISNKNYDLEKLAAYLLTRDDVTIFPKKGSWRDDEADGTKKAQTVEEAICRIPYYNQDGGKKSTIYFLWSPDQETYAKMWAQCQIGEKEYPSTRMHESIFELDLLGLREHGGALCESYWADVEPDEDDTDDDDY